MSSVFLVFSVVPYKGSWKMTPTQAVSGLKWNNIFSPTRKILKCHGDVLKPPLYYMLEWKKLVLFSVAIIIWPETIWQGIFESRANQPPQTITIEFASKFDSSKMVWWVGNWMTPDFFALWVNTPGIAWRNSSTICVDQAGKLSRPPGGRVSSTCGKRTHGRTALGQKWMWFKV